MRPPASTGSREWTARENGADDPAGPPTLGPFAAQEAATRGAYPHKATLAITGEGRLWTDGGWEDGPPPATPGGHDGPPDH